MNIIRLHVFCLALILTQALPGLADAVQRRPTDRPEQMLVEAWEKFYDGKFAEAAERFALAARLGNEAAISDARDEAFHGYGRALWATETSAGRNKARQVWQQSAKTVTSAKGRQWVALSGIIEQSGEEKDTTKMEAAADSLSEFIKGKFAGTGKLEATVELGRLLLVLGRPEDAAKVLKTVSSITAGDLVRMEVTKESAAPHIAAAKKMLKGINSAPDDGREGFEKAEKLRLAEKINQAMQIYGEVVKRYSSSKYGYLSCIRIGDCLLLANRPAEAVAAWQAFVDRSPAGPWRGQALIALIDFYLSDSFDLAKAKETAIRAFDCRSKAASDADAAASWQEAEFDILLRIGMIAYAEERFDGCVSALKEAINVTSAPSNAAELLQPIIRAAGAKVLLVPPEISATGADKRIPLMFAMARIHMAVRNLEEAKTLLENSARPSRSGRPTLPQIAYGKFLLAEISRLSASGDSPAEELYLMSIKALPNASWHDETFYQLANLKQQQAAAKAAAIQMPASSTDRKTAGAKHHMTAAEYSQHEKHMVKCREILEEGQKDALPYWQKLATNYPKSRFHEFALYSLGQAQIAAGNAAEGTATYRKLLNDYPDGIWTGPAYVAMIDVALEHEFDLKAARSLADAGIAWATESAMGATADVAVDGKAIEYALTPAPIPSEEEVSRLNYELHLRSAVIHFLAEEYEDAVRAFDCARPFAPPPAFKVIKGTPKNGIDKIIEVARKRKKLTPEAVCAAAGRVSTRLQVADILFAAGEYEEAKSLYEPVVAMSPKHATEVQRSWACFKAGRCTYAQLEPLGAKMLFLESARIARDTPWHVSALLFAANIAHNYEKKIDDAIELWRTVIKSHPGTPEAERCAYHIALALDWASRTDEARAAYENFLKSYPKSPYCRVIVGNHLPKLGRQTRTSTKQ